MKRQTFLALAVVAAALPALAQPTCNQGQVVQGNNCTFLTALGWGAAGQGNDSILTIYVPPGAKGPVNFHVTALSSSLGSAYTGYFGIRAGDVGTDNGLVVTLADIVDGAPGDIGSIAPGQVLQVRIGQVCWDPTCTGAAPAGAVSNMFSLEILIASPNSNDINPGDVQEAVRFLNGRQVTLQTVEMAIRTNSPYDIVPGINLGPAPAGRYVFTNSGGVTQPFDAISISNLENPNPLTGTVTLQDLHGNTMATASIPAIPPGGAAGFLVIGRAPGDALGLFPSSTVLPAGSDGIFHGTLLINTSGQTPRGMCIVLAQEYNGNSMVNVPVYHSPVP